MAKNLNIKKGDTVRVIAGKDKGAEGKVIAVLSEQDRVNQGGRAGTTGGIVTQEAAIHVSNVMLVEGKGTTRVGFKKVEGTKRRPDGSTYTVQRNVRVSRKTGEEI